MVNAEKVHSPVQVQDIRVGLVSSVHRWNDTRIFLKEAVSLAKKGYDVIVVGIGIEKSPFKSSGVRVYALPRRIRPLRFMTWLSIIRIIIVERLSVIHAHDPEFFLPALLMKLINLRVVLDIHENFAEQILYKEWIPNTIRCPFSKVFRVMQRLLPRLADAVILAEDSYRRDFPIGNNVSVIRNFPELLPQYKKNYRTKLVRMIYVGDVRKVRGIGEYVAIIQRITSRGLPVELRVVGSFADPNEEQQIRTVVRQLDLEKKVTFYGRRPPTELPMMLEECDIGLALLHPIGNYRESYPTKMFEYMAAGLPVVASRFTLWENVLVGNDCGQVVDPLNIEEAAEAVYKYCNSEELRERHGRNGRMAVAKRYNWNLEIEQLYTIYGSLSSRRKSSVNR